MNPIHDGSMSHTMTPVRDVQLIQATTTTESQEFNIYDDPEDTPTTRIYEDLLKNESFGLNYEVPVKTKTK